MTKTTLTLALAAGLLAGCATTPRGLNPSTLEAGVLTATALALQNNPGATAGVAIAAEVVCTQAQGTNLSPAALVLALKERHPSMSAESILITMLGVNLFSAAYGGLSDTNAARPYMTALCNGMTAAIPFGLPVTRSRNAPPRAVLREDVWPQLTRPRGR